MCGYRSVPTDVLVCVFVFFCVFVRLCISLARIKLAASTFCTAVYRRPRQGISHFCKLCSPKPNIGRIGVARALADSADKEATFVEYRASCGRRSAYVDIRQSPKTDVLV